MERKKTIRMVDCIRCGRFRKYFAKNMCRSCYCYVNVHGKIIHCTVCNRDRVYGGIGICQSCKTRQSQMKDYEEFKKRHANNERNRRKRMGEKYNALERIRSQTPKRKVQRGENMLKWQRNNKEHLKEYRKEYRQRQNEKVKTSDQNKRVRKMNAGKLTPEEWKEILKIHNHSCYYCGRNDVILEQEHKIPLIRGGKHSVENVVPACRECNARKYTKTEEEFKSSPSTT